LKSIRKLESSDVILGHYEADSGSNFKDKDNPMPTYFGAVLYVDNARWDSVPFLINAGRGLKKNRCGYCSLVEYLYLTVNCLKYQILLHKHRGGVSFYIV